ncbi:MAG: PIN domain-containing protein [Chloroflexi bacterium]|nr:PIN domain-containing protein [Chloroflexota bacterium]
MAGKVRVFLDTSALFAGIWSEKGGARAILKLGEIAAICLLVSPQVIAEIDAVLRRKAPHLLGLLAVLLDAANVEIVSQPSEEAQKRATDLVTHPGDAFVLAAALDARPDYFVTLDRVHFLDNDRLSQAVPFPVGTPGDFLAWWREQWK